MMIMVGLITMNLQAQTSAGFIKNVDAKTFKGLVDAGKGNILDVRTPEEVSNGHISKSINIDYYDANFVEKIKALPKDKEIYIYCKSGGRSSKAALILQNNGFTKVYNLEGGFTAWQANSYPSTK